MTRWPWQHRQPQGRFVLLSRVFRDPVTEP